MSPADLALARFLTRRDWSPRAALPLLASLAILSAIAADATLPLPLPLPGARDPIDAAPADYIIRGVMLPWVGDHLGAVTGVLAVVLSARRTAGLTDRWLAPFAAGGASRATIAAVTLANATALALVALLVATLAWSAGGSEPATALLHRLASLTGPAALVTACSAYGAAAAMVAGRRGRALLVALAGFAAPAALLLAAQRAGATPVPRVATRIVAAHLPLTTQRGDPVTVARQLAYTVIVATLLLRAAPSRVARVR